MKDKTESMTSFQKAWEVIFPYLLYYLAYSAAYIILAFAQESLMGAQHEGYRRFMTEHAATVAGVTGGLGRLFGILPLVPMLQRELLWCKSMRSEKGERSRGSRIKEMCSIGVLACTSSLGLNVLLTLTGFADSSGTYRQVAQNQYGVAFAAGLILYGLISPLAEEVVFRGVIFNRMRRFYGPVVAIAASGLFFGAFHGNLVQGVYGGCMGILMAWLYERSGQFVVPLFFHAAANLAVYVTAYIEPLQAVLFTPAGCTVLLAVSAGCILAGRYRNRSTAKLRHGG